MQQKGYRAIGVLLTCVGLACGSSESETGPEAVAARVNDATLTVADLDADIPTSMLQTATPEMKQDWVQQWVQSELLYQEALTQGLHKDRKIARDLQKMQRDYLANLLLERFLSQQSPEVTDNEIRKFYGTHQREFVRQETELKLSVIVLKEERTARDLWKQLSRNRQAFAERASERSTDRESAKSGGDLGFVKKNDILDPAVQRVVFSLRVGELSNPVKTDTGYCLFMAADRRDAGSVRPLEEVRGDIVNRVLEERRRNRIKQLLEELRRSAEVDLNEKVLSVPAAPSATTKGEG